MRKAATYARTTEATSSTACSAIAVLVLALSATPVAAAASPSPGGLAVTAADVPAGFLFVRRQAERMADKSPAFLVEERRAGFLAGAMVRFRRTGIRPALLTSYVSVYRTAAGARRINRASVPFMRRAGFQAVVGASDARAGTGLYRYRRTVRGRIVLKYWFVGHTRNVTYVIETLAPTGGRVVTLQVAKAQRLRLQRLVP